MELEQRRAELEKVDLLEGKLDAEMEEISASLASMQGELATFQDLEALHTAAAARRSRLTRLFDGLQSRAVMLGSEAASREQTVATKADQLMVRPPAYPPCLSNIWPALVAGQGVSCRRVLRLSRSGIRGAARPIFLSLRGPFVCDWQHVFTWLELCVCVAGLHCPSHLVALAVCATFAAASLCLRRWAAGRHGPLWTAQPMRGFGTDVAELCGPSSDLSVGAGTCYRRV